MPAAPAEGGSAARPSTAPGARPAADVAIAQLRVEDGRALVTDAASGARVDARRIAVSAETIAWPAGGPARVRASAAIDGMEVSAQGTVEAARRAADVALRVRGADLAALQPWLPIAGRVRGTAEADVRVVASHDGTLRLAVTGDATLHRLALLDGTRPLVAAARVAATGLDYTWPATARVARLTVTQPEATVERAADGTLSLAALVRRRAPAGGEAAAAPAGDAGTAAPALDVAVARVEIADGRATVTDAAVSGRAEITRLALTARDVAWPARGNARVRLSAAVAGGEVTARGTVDAGARKGELAVTLRNTDLAALQPWLPITGRVAGLRRRRRHGDGGARPVHARRARTRRREQHRLLRGHPAAPDGPARGRRRPRRPVADAARDRPAAGGRPVGEDRARRPGQSLAAHALRPAARPGAAAAAPTRRPPRSPARCRDYRSRCATRCSRTAAPTSWTTPSSRPRASR